MRRVVMGAVLVLLLGGAPPAHARSVYNSGGSQEEAAAEWFHDLGGGGFVSGRAFAVKIKGGGSFLDLFEVTGTPITCDNGTPEPDDDFPGTHLEFFSGAGPANVRIDKQFRSAAASAMLDLTFDAFDHCSFFPEAEPTNGNGGGGGVVVEGVLVEMSMTGTGPLTMSKSSSGFHIPGEVNEHSRFDSRWRDGNGVVSWLDQERIAPWGFIGKVSWRSHSNS